MSEHEPTWKSPAIDRFLTATNATGMSRQEALSKASCTNCGREITDFDQWTQIEQAEYPISGMCNKCQQEAFAPIPEDEEY